MAVDLAGLRVESPVSLCRLSDDLTQSLPSVLPSVAPNHLQLVKRFDPFLGSAFNTVYCFLVDLKDARIRSCMPTLKIRVEPDLS
jgi:hypothetical protein